METLATEEETLTKRRFFLNLSPQLGQHFAHGAGFTIPSPDTQQSENLDIAKLYLQMSHSGAMEYLADSSWWMLRIMDPRGGLDRIQANRRSDELVSYAIASIKGLMDKGIIKWGKPVADPDLSQFQVLGPKLDEVDEGVIQRMEKDLRHE